MNVILRCSARVGALFALLMALTSCGPNPNSPTSLTGTWFGTVLDSAFGTLSTQLTLTQSGSSITGTFTNTSVGAATSATGPLTGTLNGSTVTLVLGNGTCIRTWTGKWSGTTITGTLASSGACVTPDTGTFSVSLE